MKLKTFTQILLAMLLLLACEAASAASDSDVPAFLSQYSKYYEEDGWYLACTDSAEDYGGDVDNEHTHWVLLDGEGTLLQSGLRICTANDHSSPFNGFQDYNALAPLRIGEKWGYINRAGTVVIAPAYDEVKQFFDGTAVVGVGNNTVYTMDNPNGDGILYYTDRRYGLIDENGAVLLEPVYQNLLNGSGWGEASGNGLIKVMKDGLWALGNNRGELLTDFIYMDIYLNWLSDLPIQVEAVEADGLASGFINMDGTPLTDTHYEQTLGFSEGLAAVRENGRYGYIDLTGSVVIAPAYDSAGSFSQGVAAVEAPDGKWGYIDTEGEWYIKPAYEYAYGFTPAGYAKVTLKEGKHGVIDRKGKVLFKTKKENLSVSDDGVVTVNDGYEEETAEFYDLSSGKAKPVTILTASMDLTDYKPFTGKKVAKLKGKPTLDQRVSQEHDLPHLDGATALFPVYSAYVQALYPSKTRYEDYDGANNPLITCTKTNVAYERLINGEADIIFVAQPSDEELQMAAEKGVEFDMLPFGREAFVFVVNQKNPCEGLLLNEIRWIYNGLITDWSEVGVDGLGKIIPYQRPKNSGSQTALEALMDGMELMEAPQEIVAWDMGDILETVEYRNLPNAPGYSFRFFCTEMMKSEVKLLAIDGIAPTVENIRSNAYPLTSTLYAIRLKSNTENPNVNALWDWLQTDQAAELVEKSGYVAGMGE